jgi:hypothetical protein
LPTPTTKKTIQPQQNPIKTPSKSKKNKKLANPKPQKHNPIPAKSYQHPPPKKKKIREKCL